MGSEQNNRQISTKALLLSQLQFQTHFMRAILSGIKLFKPLKYICFVTGEIIESESDFLGSNLTY